jgi:hypothetical protein
MKMTAIREQARALGIINTGKMRKGDLIRTIQNKEGNQPCFEADWRAGCQQADCSWRSDCLEKPDR